MPDNACDPDNLAIIGLDADGFVYNIVYRNLVIQFINRYYDLIWFYEAKVKVLAPGQMLSEEELAPITAEIPAMLADIEDIAKHTDRLLLPVTIDVIRQRNFKSQIFSIFSTLKKFNPTKDPQEIFHSAYGFVVNQVLEVLHKLCPLVYKKIFLTSNEPLIQFLCKEMEKKKFTHVGFGFTTNRLSYLRDKTAREMNGTGCFMVDIEYIVEEVSNRLAGKVVMLNPLVLGDTENNSLAGESVQAGKESYFNIRPHKDHNHCSFDQNKYIPTYNLAQHFRVIFYQMMGLDSDVKMTMYFMDDKKEILVNIFNKVAEAPVVFPEMDFNTYIYDGTQEPEALNSVTCTGPSDYDHYATVQWMIAQCRATDVEKTIDSVKSLDLKELIKRRKLYLVCTPVASPDKSNVRFYLFAPESSHGESSTSSEVRDIKRLTRSSEETAL